MCIAILQTENSEPLTVETVERCASKHPHGMGIAWVDNGDIQVYRSLGDINEFYNVYCDAVLARTPILLHFRFKTQGECTLANTQPFYVNDDVVFCHNGHFSRHSRKSVRSDTRLFNEEILRNLPGEFMYDPTLLTLLDGYMGHNKIILLNSSGDYEIVNEAAGEWAGGTWYSNSTYKEWATKSYAKAAKGVGKKTTTKAIPALTTKKVEKKEDRAVLEPSELTHEAASKWLTDLKDKSPGKTKKDGFIDIVEVEPNKGGTTNGIIVDAEFELTSDGTDKDGILRVEMATVGEEDDCDVPDIINTGVLINGKDIVCFLCYPYEQIKIAEDDFDFLDREENKEVRCCVCEVGLIYLEEQEEIDEQRWLSIVDTEVKEEVANDA